MTDTLAPGSHGDFEVATGALAVERNAVRHGRKGVRHAPEREWLTARGDSTQALSTATLRPFSKGCDEVARERKA
jgi:hypothetical protein